MLPANEEGDTLGYIAEEPRGFLATFGRQILRTHRPFRALVMDSAGTPILWRLKDFNEYTPEGEPVLDTFAEVQQRWHLWRRRYDLFFREDPRRILTVATEPQPQPETELFQQLARVDEGLLAWDFRLRDASGHEFASIRRAFRGFGREVDPRHKSGKECQYFVRFSPTPPESEDTHRAPYVVRDLGIEERASLLPGGLSDTCPTQSTSISTTSHAILKEGMGWGSGGSPASDDSQRE
ncbi:hypothetical protein POSPLADRAFT_1031985 [Postia placenta MAD-698-R-SB12]|uniref:Phospholipid scramblase n=1 Tax=Postia placenta MAD-698-R-SB12 TaxID=670580 RepID=A0A1X6N9I8_9APHY|nr:hypothetical protein POSPLADRAFT_1031985 [Postia placenta MAD-698-R-SB12]OSX65106.1 hypothetical protein POSPLADRAFT_1031985 [Postia placenta MAD-698-R-SB12]